MCCWEESSRGRESDDQERGKVEKYRHIIFVITSGDGYRAQVEGCGL